MQVADSTSDCDCLDIRDLAEQLKLWVERGQALGPGDRCNRPVPGQTLPSLQVCAANRIVSLVVRTLPSLCVNLRAASVAAVMI